MSDPIAEAEARAAGIVGAAKMEAARIRRQAEDILEGARREREDAGRLMAKAKAGMNELRRESAARGI